MTLSRKVLALAAAASFATACAYRQAGWRGDYLADDYHVRYVLTSTVTAEGREGFRLGSVTDINDDGRINVSSHRGSGHSFNINDDGSIDVSQHRVSDYSFDIFDSILKWVSSFVEAYRAGKSIEKLIDPPIEKIPLRISEVCVIDHAKFYVRNSDDIRRSKDGSFPNPYFSYLICDTNLDHKPDRVQLLKRSEIVTGPLFDREVKTFGRTPKCPNGWYAAGNDCQLGDYRLSIAKYNFKYAHVETIYLKTKKK